MVQGEIVDPQAFIDAYGPKAPVAFDNGMQTTLGQALALESSMCMADPDKRQDPHKRIGWLAARLAAAGSLHPEHEYLLVRPE